MCLKANSVCFKDYKEAQKLHKKTLLNILGTEDLLGTYYACYKEDLVNSISYEPSINCIDQSRKQIGQYDIIYQLKLDEKGKLLVTINDPFIGKERSSQVRKVCFSDNSEEITLKSRFIKVYIYRNNLNNLELKYRFFFKRYHQALVKEA